MILGIDIGTQGAKAVVVDGNLGVRGEAASGYAISFPRPGWAEQAPALWENAIREAVAGALRAAGAEPGDIKAIGVAGQLDGCIATGADGTALAPCIVWMDRRAELPPAALTSDALRRVAGINPDPGHQAAKIRWLLDNDPACRDAVVFHQPVSYIVARLTGRRVMDHALASTTMLYSLKRRDYDATMLAAFGINRALLPDIADACSLAGTLTSEGARMCGLIEGTPVAVGTGDDYSSPLGAGVVAPGTVACIIGTAEVVGALDPQPKIDALGLVETHGYPGGMFFIENPGWLSGGALAWLTETLRLADFAELDRLAVATPPGADGLVFLPALSGAMAPEWIPSARGAFYGLSPAHGAGHIARAVLESCAFAMRDVIERFREMKIPAERILILGGGARSRVWAQIRADVSGLPVDLPDRVDTSPIGAAILAAVAAGFQPDVPSSAPLVRPHTVTIEPNPANRDACDDAYNAYRRLFESLRPMFGEKD